MNDRRTPSRGRRPRSTARRDDARRVAIECLVRIDDGAFSHILVPELLRTRALDARDRALVTDLVYGTTRLRRRLDWLMQPHSTRPLRDLDPPVRAALRIGTYQLVEGVAVHAAVGETVEAAPQRAHGFVNAVLRSLTRAGGSYEGPEGDGDEAIGVRTSHPDWIVRLIRDQFGDEDALAVLELDNTPPAVTLRVNPMRSSLDAVVRELRDAGADVVPGTVAEGALVVRGTGDIAALPAMRDGRVSPQDQASQAIVAVLDPQPGDRVFDVASAPGGKATAAAERMRDEGIVLAADLHAGRVRTVARAADRLRLRAIAPVVADGRRPPVAPGSVDRLLLDAPCSGLGVLRRRADARWRVTPDDVVVLAGLQREMLAAVAPTVRAGGRLVYAVCTLSREETIDVDEWVALHLPDFHALPPPGVPWRAHGRGALLLPSAASTDGMFVLALERSAG